MRVETGGESAAVDIESLEDIEDRGGGNTTVVRPANDIEVFLAGFQTVEDAVEEKGVFDEGALQKAEVAAVEFDPEAFSL